MSAINQANPTVVPYILGTMQVASSTALDVILQHPAIFRVVATGLLPLRRHLRWTRISRQQLLVPEAFFTIGCQVLVMQDRP